MSISLSDGSTGFVLVHGAGLGGWIWRTLVRELSAPSLAVDLPARDAPAEVRTELSFDDYVAAVGSQIRTFPAGRLVLVAHSISGVLAPRLLDMLGDRVVGFVAVGAAIPARGGSFLSTLPLPKRLVLGTLMRVVGTRPPDAAIRKGLCNDLDQETADEVVRRFAPESRALYTEPAGAAFPSIPALYVHLAADAEFGEKLQDRMAAGLGDPEAVRLETGHLPMLSRPVELARVLETFAEGLPPRS